MLPSGSVDPALLKLMAMLGVPLYGPLASATGGWLPFWLAFRTARTHLGMVQFMTSVLPFSKFTPHDRCSAPAFAVDDKLKCLAVAPNIGSIAGVCAHSGRCSPIREYSEFANRYIPQTAPY